MSYQFDTVETIYDELKEIEAQILSESACLISLGRREAETIAEYENKKNGYLIEMFAEETDKASKRTEAQRTAMYRKRFETERLKKLLAANELKAQQDYVKSLQSVLNSRQSRLRILENERKASGAIQP